MAKKKDLPKALLFSKKAYSEDKQFAEDVMRTASQANSQESHIELLEELYPQYTIVPLYTYEHSGMCIEKTKSCKWDSSADAFGAYLEEESDLDEKISEVNDLL